MKIFVKDQRCENCRKMVELLNKQNQFCGDTGYATELNDWCSNWKIKGREYIEYTRKIA